MKKRKNKAAVIFYYCHHHHSPLVSIFSLFQQQPIQQLYPGANILPIIVAICIIPIHQFTRYILYYLTVYISIYISGSIYLVIAYKIPKLFTLLFYRSLFRTPASFPFRTLNADTRKKSIMYARSTTLFYSFFFLFFHICVAIFSLFFYLFSVTLFKSHLNDAICMYMKIKGQKSGREKFVTYVRFRRRAREDEGSGNLRDVNKSKSSTVTQCTFHCVILFSFIFFFFFFFLFR